MKNYFISSLALIAIGVISCKKESRQDTPLTPPTSTLKKVIVTTFAGSAGGFSDGPLLSAQFNTPADVVVANDGTIYITDLINSRIRKIIDGRVNTFAGGSTTLTIENGNGPVARFIDPMGITTDINGNLYTLDGLDPRIRKISRTADVTTYAGIANSGFKDGSADGAQFVNHGWGIAADAQGNVFLADPENHRIRKISVNGQVTTLAGNGVGGFLDGNREATQFNRPGGIAFDQQGNLYVLDVGNYRIRKITPAGEVSTFAGNGTHGLNDGNSATAQFSLLYDIVADKDNNLYVTDEHRVRKISPQGIVSTIAGNDPGFADGEGLMASFHYASGLGIDAQGNLYVADSFNNRIRKISFE